jgi:outer membrane protein TolC
MHRFALCILAGLLLAATAPASADTLRVNAQSAVDLALKNNHAVTQALAKVEEAAAGRGAAFGSFLPQLSAGGTYFRMGTVNEFSMAVPIVQMMPLPVYDPAGNLIGFTDSIPMTVGADTMKMSLGSADNFVLRGTAQQTIFTWGKLLNAYRIAGLSLDMEKEGLRLAKSRVEVQAIEGFHNALLARKMAGLMQESYDQLGRHIDQVQTLYDNGMVTKLDVMRANVGLTNLRSQLSRVESGADLALAALRTTLGLEPDTPVALSGDLEFEARDIDLGAATESALDRRPELAQLRDAVGMADLGIRIARTANLPSLFAQFNYDYKNPVGFSPGWGTDWNLTVGTQMPLFTGLTNLNRLKQAKSRKRQARIGLAMVEDGIRLEVKALHSTIEQEQENIKYQAENVEVAESALAMAETGYENGLVTNLEYMDTQLALTQSRVSHLSSLANHRIARAKLRQAMGTPEEK